MKRITIQLATALFISTSFFSCKKEKSATTACTINMTSLSGAYKLTALKYKRNAAAPEVDYLATMDACDKDDFITLKNDGTYIYNDAGTVCTPNGNDNGTWQLNGKILTSDGMVNGTISSYDCKTLIFYIDNSSMAGDKLTFTMLKQ